MRFINNDQAHFIHRDHFIVQAVIECFDHCHKTHIIILVGQGFDQAVDYFIFYAKFGKHVGSLPAQLNPVGEDQHFFTGVFNILPGDFREYNRFSATGRQLIKEIIITGAGLKSFENLI